MHHHKPESSPSPEEKLQTVLAKLTQRYDQDGQELPVHLNGLLHSKYTNYWDYIHLDTLLTLQKPKTDFPDELIFIVYHQITELYFKLVLHEIQRLREKDSVDGAFFLKHLNRVNWYFSQLIESFDIIAVGLDQEEFLNFRSALYPASGFQSKQFRMVEIASTDFINLVNREERKQIGEEYMSLEELFENVYWKKGATDAKTGEKSLTLRQVEAQYAGELLAFAYECKSKNIWSIYKKLSFEEQAEEHIINALKKFDSNVNVYWPLTHYKYALHYLIKDQDLASATGGTNWQKYLPPKFQRRIFFKPIWSPEEMEQWGKSWVETEVFSKMPLKH